MKSYQYKTVVIQDRGFLNDPEFLEALNINGGTNEEVPCPRCGKHQVVANGWKHKEDQAMGSTQQVVLLEREIDFSCESPSQAPKTGATPSN